MVSELSPIAALKQKSADFRQWILGGRNLFPTVIETSCPKCGGRVVCAYADMGVVDYYDTYAHVCLNPECGYGEMRESFFHSNFGPDGPRPACPLCEAAGAEEK